MANPILITNSTPRKRLDKAQEIAQENSAKIDILEILTSEQKGIELARQIISQAFKQPFSGKLSSIIIAEANNLTIEAQNALLKTLEEGPAKTQIILTAPNRDSLLATVASRCQEIRLASEKTLPTKTSAEEKLDTNFMSRLDKVEKHGLDEQLLIWQKHLEEEVVVATNKANLKNLHRYNRILLKLKKAEKFSVNKKLLSLIAALEEPTKA